MAFNFDELSLFVILSLRIIQGNKMDQDEKEENTPSIDMDNKEQTESLPEVGIDNQKKPKSKLKLSKPRFKPTKKELIAGCLILLAFVVGIGGTLFFKKDNPANLSSNKPSNSGKSESKENTKPSIEFSISPISGKISWLDSPQRMAYQPVFANQSQVLSDYNGKVPFYLIGTIDQTGDQIIYLNIYGPGDGGIVFLKTGNKYVLYQQHSKSFFNAMEQGGQEFYQGPSLSSNVAIDKNSIIEGLNAPSDITYKSQKLSPVDAMWNGSFVETTTLRSDQYITYSKLGDYAQGILYEATITTVKDPLVKVINYEFLTKSHIHYYYKQADDIFKPGVTPIIWNNGQRNTDKFLSASAGCSRGISNEVALNINTADLEIIGRADGGQSIYGFKNLSNPLFAKHYQEYVEAVKNQMLIDVKTPLSANDFSTQRGIYVIQDSLGQWLVFSNDKFVPTPGCAKPVIYLYPDKPMFVNIAIGAQITKSDPLYQNGWNNVFALPGGQLIYKQQGYDSLFWEGYGQGYYPPITSGKIVKRSLAEAQIKSDLLAQGLNNKEVSDFMAFWGSKIPNKPFIRITWLNTTELREIAPLYINPKPNTEIRVFLDMEGFDKPFNIKSQKLFAPPRRNYTVVEWGGLARDGSVPRLN